MLGRPHKSATAKKFGLALLAALGLGGILQAHCNETVTLRGKLVSGRDLLPLHALQQGVVTTVYASLGEHVDKGAPLLGLDPNLSPEGLVEQERRLAAQQLSHAQLQRTYDRVVQLLAKPEQTRTVALKDLGVSGDTFALISDLYSARLELDGASEASRHRSGQQKAHTASEIALAERNVALLTRNLELSRQSIAARDSALQAKRRDFENLGKLAEKGLVSSTDVTRERDGLLQAEMVVGDARKQNDQLELDISNQRLHISELKSQDDSAAEEGEQRVHAAQVRYDLRLARLAEWKAALAQQLAEQAQVPGGAPTKEAKQTRVVHSPVAGTLVQVGYGLPGDHVERGFLLALIRPEGALARAQLQVSPLDVLRLRSGQPARVEIDAYPARRFGRLPGCIDQIFALPDGNSFCATLSLGQTSLRVYGVEAALLPNLTVHAQVTVNRRRLWEIVSGR